MKKYYRGLILILLGSFLLSGCWDYHELDKEAVISLFAYDLADHDRTTATAYLQTTQKASQSGSGDASATSPTPEVITAKGAHLYEAIKNLALYVPYELTFHHHVLSILGEKFAQSHHFKDTLDRITRVGKTRRRGLFAITSGQASRILHLKLPLADDLSSALYSLMDNAAIQQYSTRVDLNDFLFDLTTVGIEPIIPRILTLHEDNSSSPSLKVSGCGAFRHATFVGWLNAEQTRGLLWLRNRPGKSLLRFPWQDGTIVVESEDLQTNIQAQSKKKMTTPSFRIDVHCAGKIVMYTGDRVLTTEDIPSIQHAWKKEIEHTVFRAIQRAKKLRTDVIGFGNVLYCTKPRLYKAKYMAKWDERFFPQSTMMIHVESKIIAIGMTNHRP